MPTAGMRPLTQAIAMRMFPDWLMHTAALMYTNASAPSAYTALIFEQLFRFANTTSSRFPLTDHPECTGPAPVAAADRARPVLGAFYAPLLVAAPPRALAGERERMRAYLAARAAAAPPAVVSWFAASDTHLGHDPAAPNGTVFTSFEKNSWAIAEMNRLPGTAWPAALGGGAVATPLGVTISGDLIDAGDAPGTAVNGCHRAWFPRLQQRPI